MSGYLVLAVMLLNAVLVVWPLAAWTLSRQTQTWAKAALSAVIFSMAMGLPWAIPADLPWLRFFFIVPCFLAMGKTLELLTTGMASPSVLESPGRFYVWSILAPDGIWSERPEDRQAVRRRGVERALGALPKLLAAGALLTLNSAVPLHENLWISCFWMCFVMYFALSGANDLLSTPFRLAGISPLEIFNAPPLARNPRDFWSRRWNLWFTTNANRWIFQPLGGADKPLRATSAVFIFSAVLHEYMVLLSLETLDGRMTAFFLLHGVVTIATTRLGQHLGRRELMPRLPAVLLHIAWFAVTAPLFFGPVNDIMTMSEWRLW